MPVVYEWLEHAEATIRLIRDNYSDRTGEDLLDLTIAENVLTQIENLRTYPVVRSKIHRGRLALHAWVYSIESGEVLAYDPEEHTYKPPYSQIDVLPPDERPYRKKFLVWQKNFTTPDAQPEPESAAGNGHASVSVDDHLLPGVKRLPREQAKRIYQGTF
jgi:carbonic anhydrase